MTISYNRLGSNGRLGNQMFQYAGLRGIAAHNGYDFLIPPEDTPSTCNYGLFECFKMTNVSEKNIGLGPGRTVENELFHFNENLYKNCPDNVNLNGYFQTEKYFTDIEDQIREDFQFNDEIYESCKEVIDQVGDAIFLHVRRGDYVATPDHHPCLPIEYYKEALSFFPSDVNVLVFSDTLDWCKENFKEDRFLISEGHIKYPNKIQLGDGSIQQSLVPYYDLCLMTMCSGAIIANSSMSWWGAWLQDGSERVVAPNTWFGSAYGHYNMNDLLPSHWEIV
jgi:hypothetical protein